MVMEVFRRHGVKAGQGLEVNVMLRPILDSSGFDKVTGLNEVVSAGLLKPTNRGTRYTLTDAGAEYLTDQGRT